MAKAKKLPSGSWRAQVYDYTDPDKKRHYESFTAETKKEAEYLAAEFSLNKKNKTKPINFTLLEAIDKYIDESNGVLSPATISGYEIIKNFAFQSIMHTKLKDITTNILKAAVNEESKRKSTSKRCNGKVISPKTVANEYGLITAVLNLYYKDLDCSVKLPPKENKVKELISAEIIMNIVKGTEIELPVLLAMWLSFSMSEIQGLTKSKSIRNNYLTIVEVSINVDGEYITKKQAKAFTRTRSHKIPNYIMCLIDNIKTDKLVTLSGQAIHHRLSRLLEKNKLPHMTFHDLRHVNASIMALLKVPDKYAMERGGWKTDQVMKRVYTHTFSDERKVVDELIDNYFENKIEDIEDNIIIEYDTWRKSINLKDDKDTKKLYDLYKMQHEMQHEK